MPNIPKKVFERFIKTIPKYQKVLQIAKDRDINEADTVSVLNDILGEVFGYDKYLEVTSEFSVRSTFCDLAIKTDEKVQFLIEVKAIGIGLKEGHIRQAIDYGANHGVQWVILTNGIEWRLFRIRFEQPINYDLVCSFNFLSLKPKDEKDQMYLFIICKEGLIKNVRNDFYDKVKSVNRYIIGSLILSEPILSFIRRELKRLSDGIKVEIDEIQSIVSSEVLKREVVEGDEAELAKSRITKFYKKSAAREKKTTEFVKESNTPANKNSVTERLLKEESE